MLDKFGDSINIVGTPYLMSRNVDFRTFILQLSYYKNNFQPQKFSLDICYYTNLLVQITLSMVFIKHNYLKSDIFFNPIFIPCFSGSMFFRVQVFLGYGFRVRVQVLEVAMFQDYIWPFTAYSKVKICTFRKSGIVSSLEQPFAVKLTL